MPESYFVGVFTIGCRCSGGRVIVCHTRARRCALLSRRALGSPSAGRTRSDTDSVPDDRFRFLEIQNKDKKLFTTQ